MNKFKPIVILFILVITGTVYGEVYVKGSVNFGDIPWNSTVKQSLELCTNKPEKQLLTYIFNAQGMTLNDGNTELTSPITLQGIQDGESEHCSIFYIVNRTFFPKLLQLKLTLTNDHNSDNVITIPLLGKVLSKNEWLAAYPAGSVRYLHTNHVTIDTPPKDSFDFNFNMAFNRSGRLTVMTSTSDKAFLHCMHTTSQPGHPAIWQKYHKRPIVAGACGLAADPDGENIATLSDNTLWIYPSCDHTNQPLAKSEPTNKLHKACNVAFLSGSDADMLQERRNLITLGRSADGSFSTQHLVWLTLWKLNVTSKILQQDSRQLGYDVSPALIKSFDAIATVKKGNHHLVAATDLKSNKYYVEHFNVTRDQQLMKLAPSKSNFRFASKSIDFNKDGGFRVNVSFLGNAVTIESCNDAMECHIHQMITRLDGNKDFEPTYAVMNWLLLIRKAIST